MRKTTVHVTYNGKKVTKTFTGKIVSAIYSDGSSGELDDLSLVVEDRAGQWISSWAPREGDKVHLAIETADQVKPGVVKKFNLGTFFVDELEVTGPPSLVTIRATSHPAANEIKQTKRTKVWEKVTLKRIAEDIAKRGGLKLVYDVKFNPSYDRIDQTEQTDTAFLYQQAAKEGVGIKVANGTLVLFDEATYEKKAPQVTIDIAAGHAVDYSFRWASSNTRYVACQVSYTTPKKKKTISATYRVPGAPKSGPVLKLNQQVDSEAEGLRVARNALRDKNKEAGRAQLTVVGDPRLMTATTIKLLSIGQFSGTYIIDSATHQIDSGGYTTRLEIRRTLGW
ncbi:late control protein [Paenibacillus melissococcoides]|uniref:Late control protein n=2 Tax=Paenibacillus TaxID=44249 RepID=A0ABM9G977_9BACL|nr:contractile injection system protein, VgrG/Pvc8 family [Paenibacillus melissococcoides]QVQ56209.1 late control gene D protein [Paenibacillus phage Pd_22F]CAH8247454.1 late control protein [Paenibacillus melissococcoides]CAH8248541.1 late control protein [Paenibacillus melissococcoides]CAH8705096.1 late control protein [Paenibacillus melissococcoides]CAH8708322.1 late control protein [Paenibacillus melissococcoides]